MRNDHWESLLDSDHELPATTVRPLPEAMIPVCLEDATRERPT